MISLSARRALTALGVAATVLPASPAWALPTPELSAVRVSARAQPVIAVDRRLIDYGQTHQLVTFGPVGARVQLAAESAAPRAGVAASFRIIREATIGQHEGDPDTGVFAWQQRPGATTRFYALIDGARSDIVTVQVRRTVSIGIRRTNSVYTFSGQLARPQSGVQVTVARLDALTRRVAGVASARTTADGRYEIRTSLPTGMAGYYALTAATADLQAGRSRLYGLDVAARAAATLPLAGRVVTLDAGHNGGNASRPAVINALVNAGGGLRKACNTVGTSTNNGYPEHAFTFDVSRRAAALLRAQGATVVFTRPDDAGVGPCIDVRASVGNLAGSDAVVSIHGDGNLRPGARGFHVIAPVAPPVSPAVAAQSDRLARQLRQSFRGTTGLPYANYIAGGDALDARRDLGGLNLSTRPVVFIECGNMRDARDAAVMTSAAGRQLVAAGIAKGIVDYLRT